MTPEVLVDLIGKGIGHGNSAPDELRSDNLKLSDEQAKKDRDKNLFDH